MASSLIVEGPVPRRLVKDPCNRWKRKACGTHAIPALYCMMVASSGLFTAIKIML